MRTNIEIDDDLMRDTLAETGLKTKRDAVNEALRTLLRITREESIRELRGTVTWEGNLDEMRRDKVRT